MHKCGSQDFRFQLTTKPIFLPLQFPNCVSGVLDVPQMQVSRSSASTSTREASTWGHSVDSFPIRILSRTSLVAQWLRICLPMQGTQVPALVWEDPTCHGATKPVRHNYWACALESASHNCRAHAPQLLKPAHLEPMLCNKRSHPMRSPHTATKSSPCSP